jgi:hypothetical protein
MCQNSFFDFNFLINLDLVKLAKLACTALLAYTAHMVANCQLLAYTAHAVAIC